MSIKFQVLETTEYHNDVEQTTILVVEGQKYKHVAYYSENYSGYDWFNAEGVRIDDPEWAEDLDMDDIWRSNEWAKEKTNA
jgi:hypothetical protein